MPTNLQPCEHSTAHSHTCQDTVPAATSNSLHGSHTAPTSHTATHVPRSSLRFNSRKHSSHCAPSVRTRSRLVLLSPPHHTSVCPAGHVRPSPRGGVTAGGGGVTAGRAPL